MKSVESVVRAIELVDSGIGPKIEEESLKQVRSAIDDAKSAKDEEAKAGKDPESTTVKELKFAATQRERDAWHAWSFHKSEGSGPDAVIR